MNKILIIIHSFFYYLSVYMLTNLTKGALWENDLF